MENAGGRTEGARRSAAAEPAFSLRGPVAISIALWSVFLAGLTVADIAQSWRSQVEIASAVARDNYNKDLVYRRWASLQGGMYVPVRPGLDPSPWLAHVPERDVETPSGRSLTLVNPAWMTRMVHELGREQYGTIGHITSLEPIRPANAPDGWEAAALRSFEEGADEAVDLADIDGVEYLRLMRPMKVEESCLSCHAAQGYRVGDIRGGISVSIEWEPHRAMFARRAFGAAGAHALAWFAGVAVILFFDGRARASRLARDASSAELLRSLMEKEALVGELYHRTRNSLQVVDGLLKIEAGGGDPEDEGLASVIDATGRRIRVVAAVHDLLFRSKDLSKVPLDECVGAVFAVQGLAGGEGAVSRELEVPPRAILVDAAIPLCLALDELVANSLRHAFPGGARGRISIRGESRGDGPVTLRYEDSGPGLPAAFDAERDSKVGLELVRSLVERQLRGACVLVPGPGFRCELSFDPRRWEARV